MPSGTSGPSLPLNLLREIGVDEPNSRQGGHNRYKSSSRKDRRKAERSQKKSGRGSAAKEHANRPRRHKDRERKDISPSPPATRKEKQSSAIQNNAVGKPHAENPSARQRAKEAEPEDDDFKGVSDDGEEAEEDHTAVARIPRAVRNKLAEDDAEIAALERKLGLKGRKSVPKSFEEDGLAYLLGGEWADDDDKQVEKRKRKAEADEWLAQKRRKAASAAGIRVDETAENESSDDNLEDGLEDGMSNDFGSDILSEGDVSLEDADGDGDGDEEDDTWDDDELGDDGSAEESPEESAPRIRENPYVAPSTNVAKYVPPSRRQDNGTDEHLTSRIRRQLQGLVNRLTDANMVSILGDIEKMYRDNPRQHVTSILVDLLLTQISEPTSLPDTFLILTAGFAAGVYKVIGMDFGAYLVQHTVENFKQHYEAAISSVAQAQNTRKETSNLIIFISELYTFQLVGSSLIFDYIRLLLSDLTELNAELLLKIIRMSGPLLRQDDPLALKDIVALIRPAVTKIGEASISVRTKFMIGTINDLKNNKMKTGVNASALISEHTSRMKKLLGSLSSRKLRSSEPLRIGLKDIEESDKRGKWWLVGASWAGKSQADQRPKGGDDRPQDEDSDDESILLSGDEAGVPDLFELAKEQMMNTDVRRSIFVAVLSATDYEDAYARVLKLRLNRDRQREIPNVLVQCAGTEQQYNPYYTLVAKRLCSDRKVKWAFQDSLWKLFRRLGESVFGDEAEEADEDDSMDMRRLVNVAKMFGALLADGVLSLTVLKSLGLAYLQAKTKAFVEIMLITVLLEAQNGAQKGKSPDSLTESEAGVRKVFMTAGSAPELVRGLQYFIRKVVRKSDLAGNKTESKKVARACKWAEAALEASLMSADAPEPAD